MLFDQVVDDVVSRASVADKASSRASSTTYEAAPGRGSQQTPTLAELPGSTMARAGVHPSPNFHSGGCASPRGVVGYPAAVSVVACAFSTVIHRLFEPARAVPSFTWATILSP